MGVPYKPPLGDSTLEFHCKTCSVLQGVNSFILKVRTLTVLQSQTVRSTLSGRPLVEMIHTFGVAIYSPKQLLIRGVHDNHPTPGGAGTCW